MFTDATILQSVRRRGGPPIVGLDATVLLGSQGTKAPDYESYLPIETMNNKAKFYYHILLSL